MPGRHQGGLENIQEFFRGTGKSLWPGRIWRGRERCSLMQFNDLLAVMLVLSREGAPWQGLLTQRVPTSQLPLLWECSDSSKLHLGPSYI